MKRNEQSLRDPRDMVRHTNTCRKAHRRKGKRIKEPKIYSKQ
jgi:hypothetical protein